MTALRESTAFREIDQKSEISKNIEMGDGGNRERWANKDSNRHTSRQRDEIERRMHRGRKRGR